MKNKLYIIKTCFFTAILLLSFTTPAFAQDLLSGRPLIEGLRQGGYIIYFRHAATDWSQDDNVTADGDWTSCDPDRMRQLSDQGRLVARQIGAAIRRLKIPIGRILSSEYCRTRETAQLMNLGPVRPTRTIMNMRVADMVGGREAVIERARREIGKKPGKGTNAIIVAHGNLMQAATGAYAGEAGAGIFEPQGNGQFQIVAQVVPEEWAQLADRFGTD